ncbi:hypothetical protein M9Y10_027798 [Tritrichomonas musculus]|uniref:dual-specificity kinase n=1 Tax=Tritrichomonas musculus TaxID=1915356 RepID=A0ABR2H430_9EUKA
MSESNNNPRPISSKSKTSPRREKPSSQKPQYATKRNKKDILLATPEKNVNPPNDNSLNLNKNTGKKGQNNDTSTSSPHHKRNHSQIDMSSGFFDSQSLNNDDEFEHQIQNMQTNLSPGVTIGRDGKTPVSPTFVKHKYKDMLTPYEMTEINDYPDIFFVGNSISKKITKGSFDQDNTFQYNTKVGDHIAYRYEILSILGKGVFGTVARCIDHKTKEKVAIKILVNTPVMHQQGQIEVENMKLISSNIIAPGIKPKEHFPAQTNIQLNRNAKSKRSSSSEILQPQHEQQQYEQNPTETHSNPSLKHVVKMIDSFVFRNHICIVTEVLGESLYDYMKRKTLTKPSQKKRPNTNSNSNSKKEKKQTQPEEPEQLDPLPAQMVKLIAYQIMDGLAAIHRKKIIHADLKPENILFTTPPGENSPTRIKPNVSSPSPSSAKGKKRTNHNINNNVGANYPFSVQYQSPRKIASHFTVSFSVIDNFNLKSQVKIIDFGSSCRQGELIFNYIQSRFYRAPEVVLGSNYGTAIDIWSAGCIIAELFVGKPLFPATNEIDLLYRFIETLGAPPQSVIQMLSDFNPKATKNSKTKVTASRNRFFSEDGKLANLEEQPVPMRTRLTTFLKSSDTMMIDFLTKCLEWDKTKRLSAAKLLKHPWISGMASQKI